MESNQNYTPDTQVMPKDKCNYPVVICVSGGADSVALLHMALFSTLDIHDGKGNTKIQKDRIAVFHLNHCLRGDDSDGDEAYVSHLCKKHNLPLRSVRIDIEAQSAKYGGNIENAGREVRYEQAFQYAKDLCESSGVDIANARILTAHTANDRAETFLMNVMRGTSLTGLTSISRVRGIIVRPLLQYTHEELEQWLVEHGIEWRVDSTNKDTAYLRSYVRYNVLPPIKSRMPQAPQKISMLCDILDDEDNFMKQEAKRAFDKSCLSKEDTAISFDVNCLNKQHPAILRRVVAFAIEEFDEQLRISSRSIKDVIAILHNNKASAKIVGDIDVRIENGRLYLRRSGSSIPESIFCNVPDTIRFADYIIEFQIVQNTHANLVEYIRNKCNEDRGAYAFVDTSKLDVVDGGYELMVESLSPGDSFQPFGMHGKTKLVSDLLHEARIPTHKRVKVPLIKDKKTGAIMCVGGIRTDDRYSCNNSTQEFIQLKFRKE